MAFTKEQKKAYRQSQRGRELNRIYMARHIEKKKQLGIPESLPLTANAEQIDNKVASKARWDETHLQARIARELRQAKKMANCHICGAITIRHNPFRAFCSDVCRKENERQKGRARKRSAIKKRQYDKKTRIKRRAKIMALKELGFL